MKQITLTQGQVAIVDDVDYEWLSKFEWYAQWNEGTKSFYAARNSARLDGKQHQVRMHREILGLKRGDKRQGDHVNHDTLNNQRDNLRVATQEENLRNQKHYRNNKSGFKGVHWDKDKNKWRTQIQIGGRKQMLGRFDTPEAAAAAYDRAAKRLHGAFAYINGANECPA